MLLLLWLLVASFSLLSGLEAALLSSPRTVYELKYTRAHSLGDGYQFDARHGWETVNVTNLQYKYSRAVAELESIAATEDTFSSHGNLATEKSKPDKRKSSPSNASKSTFHVLNDVWKGLKGVGDLQKVKITWYVKPG
jgi:hypothetical protein